MHPSLFYRPGALLSQPELSAARIDGLLVEVGEGYMPADLPEDAAARATSLSPILVPGFAVCGPSAAWVQGAGDAPPSRHHLQRVSERRPRVTSADHVVIHERRIDSAEVMLIDGIAVTTPVRTLTDLVLGAGRDPETDRWMRCLASAVPELLPVVRRLIAARTRMPGKRAALKRIDDLQQPQEDVTR